MQEKIIPKPAIPDKDERVVLPTDSHSLLMKQQFKWKIDGERFIFQNKEMERLKLREFLKVINKLNYFEKMKWGDVVKIGKKHTHAVDSTQHLEYRNKLTQSKIDDAELWQLAINDEHRVFGCVNSEGVFLILLNDPHHKQTKTH